MKKILALLLAMTMILAMFSACGGGSTSAAPAEEPASAASSAEAPEAEAPADVPAEPEAPAAPEAAGSADEAAAPADEADAAPAEGGLITTDYTYELPLYPEGEYSFTMWVSFSDNMSTFMPNGFADNLAYQRAEEITGVHVELETVTTAQNSELFNLRVASGDLPNVITNVAQLWTGSYDSAIEDDVFIDLTEMVENYMPAYKECYDQLPEDTKRDLHTDEGNFPRLISINNYPDGSTEGYFVRTDYLEKIGKDIPTTYEELDEVLHLFQSELGLTEPLLAMSSLVHTSNGLVSGYGVNGGFSTFPMFSDPYFVVDGEVKFGIIEEGYKEFMTMFSTYYEEGIIHHDFITQNTNPMDLGGTISSGTTGVFPGETNMVPSYVDMGKATDPDFEIAPLPIITKEKGEITHFAAAKSPISGRVAGIAVSLNQDTDLEKLGKYLDFFFTEEGALLSAMGVEGNEDGSYIFDENGELQYSDYWYNGLPDLTENNKPTLFIYSVMPMLCPKTPSNYTMELQEECAPVWDANADSAYRMPDAISMTTDESSDYNAIYGDIRTLLEENLTKFATCEKSMDEWDDFVQQIYDLGIEECIEIQQAAVDRYYTRAV